MGQPCAQSGCRNARGHLRRDVARGPPGGQDQRTRRGTQPSIMGASGAPQKPVNIQGDDLIHFGPSGKKATRVSAWEPLAGCVRSTHDGKGPDRGVGLRATLSGPRLPIMVFRALFNYGRWASAALLMTDVALTTGGAARQVAAPPASQSRLPTSLHTATTGGRVARRRGAPVRRHASSKRARRDCRGHPRRRRGPKGLNSRAPSPISRGAGTRTDRLEERVPPN